MSRPIRHRTLCTAAVALCLGACATAQAGPIEISLGFSFNRSNYTAENFNWTRRWGASVGYHLTERTELEATFQEIVDRTLIKGYEDTTFHDRIYSVNWVQNLLGRDVPVQPYFKLGVGQLNRETSGSYANGASPPSRVDSITGVVAAGLRVYLTQNFAIRSEATSYLAGGRLGSWSDNFAISIGISYQF